MWGVALTNAEEMKFEQYDQKCLDFGIHFVPLVNESFEGFSELVRKTLKPIALLVHIRSSQSIGLSIAYNRSSQEVSVTITRGSATMLIARNALL